jgi:hypothetical protein
MSGVTKDERLAKIHAEALIDFAAIQSAQRDVRKQCLADRRFYSIPGAMWEGPIGQQFENKPKLEVNKVHLAIIRIFNEYRNNRITVDFQSRDGTNNDELADTCNGLYRADEQDSGAEEAYDNAFEEGVGGGIGGWRLRACYEDDEDDDDERQRIRIEPIFDADTSIYFDLEAKRQDKSDAKRCYVLTSMTKDAYKEEWDDDPDTWPKENAIAYLDWQTPDVIFVAEVYKVEEKKEVIHVFRGSTGDEVKHTDDELAEPDDEGHTLTDVLAATGYREVRSKKLKKRKIHKYIMSGGKVLEDCGYIAGKNIPIVIFYGKRWFVDNIERCMGHGRLAMDSARLKNMLTSKLAEISALSTVSKPILTPEQIAGHAVMWANDNIVNNPYLLINLVTDANGTPVSVGPTTYTKVPEIPPALAALMQITEQDVSDLLGNQEAGEQLQPNQSGKAVELVQNRLDMQAYIYMSNMSKAVKRSGEIWLSMAKELFVEDGRKMKTVDPQGEPNSVELMKPVMNEKTGATEYENDLSKADFDLTVTVGPTSSSKRAAAVRGLTGMMTLTQDSDMLGVLSLTALMNLEGEGISDIRKYARKQLVNKGVIEPTDEEAQAMQEAAANQQPDPQAEFLKASAAQAEAQATKGKADAILTMAKVDLTKAQTAETIDGMHNAGHQEIRQTVDMMHKHANTVANPQQPVVK